MASNAVLKRKAEEAIEVARMISGLTYETEHVYDQTRYAARSWKRERRVIIKAEVVQQADKAPKDNPRFVVTNMKQSPQWIYEDVYCRRGEIENRIKELKALDVDRTSCTNFWANQLRVLMTAAAYVLMQEVRLAAALTAMARAQAWTLRECLLKLGSGWLLRCAESCCNCPSSSRSSISSSKWPTHWEPRPDRVYQAESTTGSPHRQKHCRE